MTAAIVTYATKPAADIATSKQMVILCNGEEIERVAIGKAADRLHELRVAEQSVRLQPAVIAVDGITAETVAQAVAVAQSTAPAMADKITMTYSNLQTKWWQFDAPTATLRIQSATSDKHYQATNHSCTCAAGRKRSVCWHRIARRLLVLANDYGQPDATMPRLKRVVMEREAAKLVG